MKLRVKLSNVVLSGGDMTADLELDGPIALPPISPPDSVTPPPIVVKPPLPAGYSTDLNVAYGMLRIAMDAAGLTPTGVQDHGDQIIAGLKATYPALDVYLSPSDAPVWPGFGSIDVTIDSGLGGWSFRVDHVTPWKPPGER